MSHASIFSTHIFQESYNNSCINNTLYIVSIPYSIMCTKGYKNRKLNYAPLLNVQHSAQHNRFKFSVWRNVSKTTKKNQIFVSLRDIYKQTKSDVPKILQRFVTRTKHLPYSIRVLICWDFFNILFTPRQAKICLMKSEWKIVSFKKHFLFCISFSYCSHLSLGVKPPHILLVACSNVIHFLSIISYIESIERVISCVVWCVLMPTLNSLTLID